MSVEEYAKQTLWPILIETVHALIMYPNHKAYTRDVILPEKPDISATELATRLKMPLGEAVVILYELSEDKKMKP
jgi:CTP-dependent riboflavin kinase